MYNEFELKKFVVPEFVFGVNARIMAGNYAKNLGAAKVLIVTSSEIIKAGWIDDIIDELKSVNINSVVYSKVHPNPRDFEVMDGASLFREERCNFIIAIGGGSVIDCAKGIGIVHTNNKSIKSFQGIDMVEFPGPPIICIPTTSGSSADVSQFAIILDTARKVKMALVSKTLVPDVALIDPILLTTLPDYLIACTAMDALTHGIEAYISTAQSAISDVHALEAIRLISKYLVQALSNKGDMKLLTKLMLGSLHAGLAFSNASLGAVHAMAHSLGGLIDLPHGECNAVLLRHIIDYNYHYAEGRYEDVGHAMGIGVSKSSQASMKELIIEKIDELNYKLKIRKDFKSFGISKNQISLLELNALKDCCMVTNPRVPKIGEMEVIYERVL